MPIKYVDGKKVHLPYPKENDKPKQKRKRPASKPKRIVREGVMEFNDWYRMDRKKKT